MRPCVQVATPLALYTGKTLANFQSSGNIPVSKLWLIIIHITSEMYGLASLRGLLEILSSPQLLDVLNSGADPGFQKGGWMADHIY